MCIFVEGLSKSTYVTSHIYCAVEKFISIIYYPRRSWLIEDCHGREPRAPRGEARDRAFPREIARIHSA